MRLPAYLILSLNHNLRRENRTGTVPHVPTSRPDDAPPPELAVGFPRPRFGFPRRGLAILALAAACALLGAGARAETPEERIRALEQQVEALKAEIAALRAQGLPADRLAEIERRMELLSKELETLRIGEAASSGPLESVHGLGPAASKVYRVNRGVSIGGYGEALYESLPGETDNADLLRAVLYFGYKWTDAILFNSEFEFEHATTGEGDEEKGEVS